MAPATTTAELAARHDLTRAQAEALDRYVDLILGWPGNVTGLRHRRQIVGTLLGDALALLDVPALRERVSGSWLDLGAGAGIPGVPLAVARPEAALTVLDASSRKCVFLERAVAVAGLKDRTTVVCSRSERYAAATAAGREAYAVVFARAVAPLAALVELAAPLLARGGVLLASKTRSALADEGPAAEAAAPLCSMTASVPVSLPRSPLDQAVCAVYEKTGPTPPGLPRREGRAVARPLGS